MPAAAKLNFERAAEFRNQILALEKKVTTISTE